MGEKRETKKSRLVSDFSDCIVDMVHGGNEAPTKRAIVDCVVTAALGPGASVSIKTLLEDELANELNRYFPDAVRAAAEELGFPHHMVTKDYYSKSFPKSKEEARCMVASFANGRSGKAHGVRFVLVDDHDDPLLLIVAEKRLLSVNGQVDSVNTLIREGKTSGSLPSANLEKLGKRSQGVLTKD